MPIAGRIRVPLPEERMTRAFWLRGLLLALACLTSAEAARLKERAAGIRAKAG